MKLHRFLGDFKLLPGRVAIKDKALVNQIKNVLRLEAGQRIVLADGWLNEAVAEISAFSGDDLSVEILTVSRNVNEPNCHAVLYCSILKRENFELVAQKATEVGISEIMPIISQRTVKIGLKYDRLRKIVKEAAEQSGRGFLPVLREVTDFESAMAGAKENKSNILFDSFGAKFVPPSGTNLARPEKPRIGVFIGPEGGWSQEEIAAAKEAGFKIASLGKLTLRAETAAIAAAYLVCSS